MTDDAQTQRRLIADTLVTALERRHEVLDAVVGAEDYDAAIEAIADLLDVPASAAEAVLRLSFDRLTKVARRRIATELENLAAEESVMAVVDPTPGPARRLQLRPFDPERDRDVFAARTADVPSAGDGTAKPAGELDDEIRDAAARVAAEEAAWLVAEVGAAKVGMVFGELSDGEIDVRIWIHPGHRKQGYGTAALRASRSELAAYFPAVPLVVRAPAVGG
ncbi:GNAT family N-acetyltransferase [Mycobacterium sp. SMC-4]|uniref:GNAT family N-acetyltransferase n=1 Tax=Mycobacterium sp. SMC-4 TaxID=2857059 RepID=UPI0021B3A9D4|nr:GNAT family N-acetyltransferase [Mycobacterium sp. SMC-4]UXA19873.1 GNAT family N-acetyltransferase [Mycobacterium sp. SMC-4]